MKQPHTRAFPRTLASLLIAATLMAGSLCAGLAATAPAAHADEQLTDATYREFYRTGRYLMWISGKAQSKARIYHSRRAGAFLVLGSDYKKALLIQPREKQVRSLSEDEVAERPDKGVDIVKDATIEDLGALRVDRGGMAIKVEGLVARLQPQPNLLGALSAAEVLLHSPEYERAGAGYKPRAADINKLRKAEKEIEIIVFFGSWCPTCKRLLPRILKVDEAIKDSKVTVTYYGLPKGRAMRSDAAVRKNRIKRIPTAVIMIDGASAGQISSKSLSRPEAAFLRALGS